MRPYTSFPYLLSPSYCHFLQRCLDKGFQRQVLYVQSLQRRRDPALGVAQHRQRRRRFAALVLRDHRHAGTAVALAARAELTLGQLILQLQNDALGRLAPDARRFGDGLFILGNHRQTDLVRGQDRQHR